MTKKDTIRIEMDLIEPDEWPLSIPCPNQECGARIPTTVKAIEAKTKVTCDSCKTVVTLNKRSN